MRNHPTTPLMFSDEPSVAYWSLAVKPVSEPVGSQRESHRIDKSVAVESVRQSAVLHSGEGEPKFPRAFLEKDGRRCESPGEARFRQVETGVLGQPSFAGYGHRLCAKGTNALLPDHIWASKNSWCKAAFPVEGLGESTSRDNRRCPLGLNAGNSF